MITTKQVEALAARFAGICAKFASRRDIYRVTLWLGFIGAGLLKLRKDISNIRVRYTRQLSFDYKARRYLVAFRHQIHGLRLEKPSGRHHDICSLADAENFYNKPAAGLKP